MPWSMICFDKKVNSESVAVTSKIAPRNCLVVIALVVVFCVECCTVDANGHAGFPWIVGFVAQQLPCGNADADVVRPNRASL